MNRKLALAFVVAVAVPAFSQQSGIAAPPESSVQDIPAPVAMPVATPAAPANKPSAAKEEVYGAYVPYGTAATAPAATPVLRQRTPKIDVDSLVVTEVARKHNELPVGTSLRMRLNTDINTETTTANSPFTAELVDEVTSEGRVVIPAGSQVEGRVTEVRGGKRIRGTAMIHLQMDNVVLPDGSRLPLHAAVIDTDQFGQTRVDGEGNILRKDHVGATLATMSLVTGGAAAAGGVFGGAPGALIGAGVGAGLSTVMWLKRDRQAYLPEGTAVVLNLTEPMAIAPHEVSMAPVGAATTTAATLNPAPPVAGAPQAFAPAN